MVLLISSFTMVMAVQCGQDQQAGRRSRSSWSLTILCACVFLVVKYFEYAHKFEEGWLPGKYYHATGDSIPGQSRLRHVLRVLLHDDRSARNPYSGRHRIADRGS